MIFVKLAVLLHILVSMVTVTESKKGAAVSVEELRDLLTESIQNTISLTALAEQQTQKMEKVMNSLEEAEKAIEEMKEKLAATEEKLSEEVGMLNEAQAETQANVDTIGGKVTQLKETEADLSSNFQFLSTEMNAKKKTWVDGSYCIMANGDCPTGFTRFEGFLKAVSTYAANGNYIKTAQFGNSFIRCHGSCGRWPNWYAEIQIITCCK